MVSYIRWVVLITSIASFDKIVMAVNSSGILPTFLPFSLPFIGYDAIKLYAWIIICFIGILFFSPLSFKYMPLEKIPLWVQIVLIIGLLYLISTMISPGVVGGVILALMLLYGYSPNDASHDSVSFKKRGPSEEKRSKNSENVTIRTGEYRDPLDIVTSFVTGKDEHGYQTTISEDGQPDVHGHGNTPEEAQERARREYQFQKKNR